MLWVLHSCRDEYLVAVDEPPPTRGQEGWEAASFNAAHGYGVRPRIDQALAVKVNGPAGDASRRRNSSRTAIRRAWSSERQYAPLALTPAANDHHASSNPS